MDTSKCVLKVDDKKINAQKGDILLFTLFENGLFAQGETKFRKRGGFCGMGICQECLVKTDNGEQLACQIIIDQDMEIKTDV